MCGGGVGHPKRATVEQDFAFPVGRLRDEVDDTAQRLATIQRRGRTFDDLYALEIDRGDAERRERAGAATVEGKTIRRYRRPL